MEPSETISLLVAFDGACSQVSGYWQGCGGIVAVTLSSIDCDASAALSKSAHKLMIGNIRRIMPYRSKKHADQ